MTDIPETSDVAAATASPAPTPAPAPVQPKQVAAKKPKASAKPKPKAAPKARATGKKTWLTSGPSDLGAQGTFVDLTDDEARKQPKGLLIEPTAEQLALRAG